MIKVQLGALDSEVAKVLADRRGITVTKLISELLHEEAAIELTSWRASSKDKKNSPNTEDSADIQAEQ